MHDTPVSWQGIHTGTPRSEQWIISTLVLSMCSLIGGATRLSTLMPLERHAESNLSVCDTEFFEPKICRDDEVVMVTEALYGRMTTGKCIKDDYGYLGCKVDVTLVLDRNCSGRRTCKVMVPNPDLKRIIEKPGSDGQPVCPVEFKKYLQVSYSCVKVEMEACKQCGIRPKARLTTNKGYLAGIVTTENEQCGTSQCPWLIVAHPGQSINVTLFDFSGKTQEYTSPDNCNRYAVIKEDSRSEPSPVCAEKSRQRHLYTSVSNSIVVQIISPAGFQNRGQFLIYYQVIGCADYTPPDNTWMKREHLKLEVGCEADRDKTWRLMCEGNKWKGGSGISCPHVTDVSPQDDVITLPLGVLVAIVVGIALVIGVLILTIGVVCLKRQQRGLHTTYYYRTRHDYDYPMGDLSPEMYIAPKSGSLPNEPSKYQPVMIPHSRHPAPRENWYKRIELQSRPLPSLPNIAEASGGSASTVSRSDDDPRQATFAAEVHRSDSDRERRYLTNPRPSRSSLQQRPPNPAMLGGVPVTGAIVSGVPGAMLGGVPGTGAMQGGIPGGRPPPTARKPTKDGPQYFVLDTDKGGVAPLAGAEARRAARAANAQASEVKAEGKSPEEENAENVSKEFSRNNSCHEIPLRPTRISATNVNNTSNENTTGKTSWP